MTCQPPLPVIETPRLALRRLTTDDADFILELLNGPSLLRYIGDKGVRTLKRILAVTSPDNEASIRLLEKLGFQFERMARLSEDAPEVKVFASLA